MIQDHKSKEAIQYVAGLIDAEGYFRLRSHHNRKNTPLGADFKLEMTNKECIEFAAKVLGIYEIKEQNRGEGRLKTYSIGAGKSGNLLEIINLLLPYLNEKGRQIRLMKEYLEWDINTQKIEAEHSFNVFTNEKYKSIDTLFFSIPYLAGILDGDGIISITKQPSNNLYLGFGLEQCYERFVKALHILFGGSFQKRKKNKAEHRDSYVWMTKHEQAKEICKQCLPYMIEKRKKAELVIQVVDLKEEIKQFKTKRTNEILSNYQNKS